VRDDGASRESRGGRIAKKGRIAKGVWRTLLDAAVKRVWGSALDGWGADAKSSKEEMATLRRRPEWSILFSS